MWTRLNARAGRICELIGFPRDPSAFSEKTSKRPTKIFRFVLWYYRESRSGPKRSTATTPSSRNVRPTGRVSTSSFTTRPNVVVQSFSRKVHVQPAVVEIRPSSDDRDLRSRRARYLTAALVRPERDFWKFQIDRDEERFRYAAGNVANTRVERSSDAQLRPRVTTN